LGRFKSLKVDVDKQSSVLEDYTVAVMFTLLDQKMLHSPALEAGFLSGEIKNAATFQSFFNIAYVSPIAR